MTHVSANLALSWHIWPPTWPQLNPSWRQVGMTSPILGQSSPQLRHPGATLDQTIAKGQFWNKFGTMLAPFWDSFGNISAPFGEHLCCFHLHFNKYLIYFAIKFPTLDIDKYTTTSKRFCESISFLPWGRRQRRQPSDPPAPLWGTSVLNPDQDRQNPIPEPPPMPPAPRVWRGRMPILAHFAELFSSQVFK